MPVRSVAADRTAFLQQLALRENTEKALTIVVAPLYGTALASLPVAGQRLLERRGGFPAQPGHWLLVLLGLLYLLFALVSRFQEDLIHPPASVVAFLLVAALLTVSISAVVHVTSPAAWRVMFWAILGATAFLTVACLVSYWNRGSSWMFGAGGTLYITAGLTGLVAVLRDLYLRPKYDLFHWLGVSVLIGTFAAPMSAHGIGRALF